MTLVVDIGNSQIKYHHEERTYFTIEDLKKLVNKPISELLVVSTVPSKNQEQIELLQEAFDIEQLRVFDPQKQELLKNIYPGIGADRVAKLLGALALKPAKDIILVDFGTATTITVSNKNYEYQCGLIALGLHASLEVLAVKTSELPNIKDDFDKFYSELCVDQEATILDSEGDSTAINIFRGAYYSQLAMLEKFINDTKLKLPEAATICTGGLAKYFSSNFDEHIESSSLLQSCSLICSDPSSNHCLL